MSTSPVATAPAARATAALHALVSVRWEDTVVATRHLGDGAEATVGAAVSTMLPLPCESLGVPAVVVAQVRGGAAVAFVPRGAVGFRERPQRLPSPVAGPSEIVLAAGEAVSFAIGGFVITVTAEEAARAPWAATIPLAGSFAPARGFAIAALAHALVMGLSAQAAYASSLDDVDPDHDAMKGYLAAAEERTRIAESVTSDSGMAELGVNVNEKDGNGKDGGGVRAAGKEGAMGASDSRSRAQARFGVTGDRAREQTAALSREEAIAEARTFGMVGMLMTERSRAPVASFGDAAARGADAFEARGAMWGTAIGETWGAGGLGLTGVGEGGGGVGKGIGLGDIGTIGHTFGRPGDGTGGGGGPLLGLSGRGWGGSWGGSWDVGIGRIGTIGHIGVHTPEVYNLNPRERARKTAEEGEGRLPADTIRRIVRQSSGVFRSCYQGALLANPTLAGGVTTRFLIGGDGRVKSAVNAGADLPAAVVSCVTRAFQSLAFPEPPGGAVVTVTYPLTFTPSG